MNSEDCGMTAAEQYMYIAALIAAGSLFRIHCHMARTVLEISHSLSNQQGSPSTWLTLPGRRRRSA